MNLALAELNPEVCLVYLDDIIVHSLDLDSHLNMLERLFVRLLRAGVMVMFSKCMLLHILVTSGKCVSEYPRSQRLYIH